MYSNLSSCSISDLISSQILFAGARKPLGDSGLIFSNIFFIISSFRSICGRGKVFREGFSRTSCSYSSIISTMKSHVFVSAVSGSAIVIASRVKAGLANEANKRNQEMQF